MPKIHARTEWCPFCSPPVRLVRKNLDAITAIKGCGGCKRKITFTRTDTPEGRAARASSWRAKAAQTAQDKPDVTEAE